MFRVFGNISHDIHNLFWRDKRQSLCARAWEHRGGSKFWAAWVWTFGREHCRRSHAYYHKRR